MKYSSLLLHALCIANIENSILHYNIGILCHNSTLSITPKNMTKILKKNKGFVNVLVSQEILK